jgi:hypothetical protein
MAVLEAEMGKEHQLSASQNKSQPHNLLEHRQQISPIGLYHANAIWTNGMSSEQDMLGSLHRSLPAEQVRYCGAIDVPKGTAKRKTAGCEGEYHSQSLHVGKSLHMGKDNLGESHARQRLR